MHTDIAALAREAFIYGYATVDLYNILYQYVADETAPEYKAPLNAISNSRQLASPEDKAIVAMNCDTLYSYAWLDLRIEPVVLSLPRFETNRYLSLMLADLYAYINGYVTPRTNGNAGGDFLVAGPDWNGPIPEGIKRVFHMPTQLALAFYRTQLFGTADLGAAHALQDQFLVQPLSRYLRSPAPQAAAPLRWCKPLEVRKEPGLLHFFTVLNWMLQYMPVLEGEMDLRRKLAAIGVEPAPTFHEPATAAERAALVQGMQVGQRDMMAFLGTVKSSAELFGSRETLGHKYINRATGAMVGILGNSAEEYLGIGYMGDAAGQPFDGAHCYRIKFGPHDLPPVQAFWSITVYDADMLLYANRLHRYVINSPMLDRLVKDADGGFTICVQHESPGADKESNWLPVPTGKFTLTFRTYQPGPAILDGSYHAPPVSRVVDRRGFDEG